MNSIGKKLRILRELKGYTQTKAAELLQINNKTLSDYERGVTQPDLITLKQIANLYEVSTDYILGNSNDSMNNAVDEFQFALYGEVKDLTDEQKQDILEMVKLFKKHSK